MKSALQGVFLSLAFLLSFQVLNAVTTYDAFPTTAKTVYKLGDESFETSPLSARVIGVNDTFNTNQNLMDVVYWSSYDATNDQLTFYTLLNA